MKATTIYTFVLQVSLWILQLDAFISNWKSVRPNNNQLCMKWSFNKGMGSMRELGLIGSEGEFYFHPTKTPSLDQHQEILGKTQIVPIYPYSNILAPAASDWLNIFEMKHRQLINDVGEGYFGFCHYSQTNQKLGLVGTLARIKDRKILSDGRTFVIVEGVKRFYLKEFVAEKPYIKAKVQTFKDFSEEPELVKNLEEKIYIHAITNIKMMQLLYPTKNFTISENILQYRPDIVRPGVRAVSLQDVESEINRSSDFSFSVLEMLQVTPALKLSLLQEFVVERRLEKILKILESAASFLKGEILKKGLKSESELNIMKSDIINEIYTGSSNPQNWTPENFVDGKWVQKPISM